MKKIAIVEDERGARQLERMILRNNYSIQEYEDGIKGWAGIQKDPPDLIILDIFLPGMKGTEIIKKIREDENLKLIPVIAATSQVMTGARKKYLSEGFDDFISKGSINNMELLSMVRKLLEKTQ